MKKTLFLVGALFAGSAAFAAEDTTVDFSFKTSNDVKSIQLDASDTVLSILNASIDVSGTRTLSADSIDTTYYAPDTNVQNYTPSGRVGGPWTLTFNLTNTSNQAIILTGIDLSVFSFNASNLAQTGSRTIDFTVSVGESAFSGGAATSVANNFGKTSVDTTGSFTLDAGSSVSISIKADKNAVQNEGGCYVGLTGGSISYQVTPEPTTATLSLLALAGLCARRRRK